MDKIVFKKAEKPTKERRATVVVKKETYKRVADLSDELNIPIESIVNRLLEEALKYVEIV